jgi:hypothetical protein
VTTSAVQSVRAVLLLLRVMKRTVQAFALLSDVNPIVGQSGLVVQCTNCGDGKVGRDGAGGTVHFSCSAS